MADITKAVLGAPVLVAVTVILVLCAWTASAVIVAKDSAKRILRRQ